MKEGRSNLDQFRSEGDLNTSPSREEWNARHIGDETRDWLAKDERCFLHQSLSTPCLNVLKNCQGSTLEDLEGRKILDFHGNNVHQVGFSNSRVIAAITQQLQELSFCTRRYTNVSAIQLAEKLVDLAPGDLNRVLFAPSGTAAIGMALKLARAATGRFKTVSMWDSFHGASLDAVSIGGEAIFRYGIGPLLTGCEHVPPPDSQHCPWDCKGTCSLKCADYIEYVLEKEGDVAAVIGETVRCTPFIPPLEYWQKVRAACDKHGTLLILDEIPTCLGRTGKMFSCEHYNIVPDMLVIGKGLGGGIFPLAALLARDHLNCMPEQALGHYTHEKNPVATAAALAAIQIIEDDGLLDNAIRLGSYGMEKLRSMKERFQTVGDVRGLGLIFGVELVRDRVTMERATSEAEQVMYEALSRGLNFKTTMGNIITLTPPLTVSEDELSSAFKILEDSIAVVCG